MNALKTLTIGLFLLASCITVFAQQNVEPIKLAGPRFGFTAITGPAAEVMKDNNLSPFMSQFGWQFETRYFQTESGYQGLIEFVPLVAGLESRQSSISANILVGFRTPRGLEVGVGPNFAARGLFSPEPSFSRSLVYAIGHSFRIDDVNVPVNIVFSPTPTGSRITALVGFNIRQRNP